MGVIAGRVTDEHGDPVQGASVGVLQVRYENGRRMLAPPRAVAALVSTDDHGAYRLFGLMPGQYLVSAEVGTLGTTDLPGYTRTLFPGTAMPSEAQLISIGRFPEVSGIDFRDGPDANGACDRALHRRAGSADWREPAAAAESSFVGVRQ